MILRSPATSSKYMDIARHAIKYIAERTLMKKDQGSFFIVLGLYNHSN